MATPRRRIPRPACSTVLLCLAVFAAAVWVTVRSLVMWVSDHPWILGAVALLAAGSGAATWRGETNRPTDDLHALSPAGFEDYVASLCWRDGCTDVQIVGGSGDLGADVLAVTPTGRRMLIQCKRYAPGRRVGSPEVQKVGGTYQIVHGAQLAVVVTTAAFTEAAVDYAERAGIRLVDGVELSRWAAERVLPPWGGERMMGA